MTPTETFILGLRRDPRFAGQQQLVNDFAKMLENLDFNGDENPNDKGLSGAIQWVISQPDSVEKRALAIVRLFQLGKAVNLHMQEFYRTQ
jgi:hypothetical protein